MLAVEFVEIAIVGRVMLRSVPPVPIAAFGDQKFFVRQLALRFAGLPHVLGIKLAGMVKVVPGAIVLGSADPDVEIGINPRSRYEGWQRGGIRMARNRFGNRYGLKSTLMLECIVEAPQKLPPRFRE